MARTYSPSELTEKYSREELLDLVDRAHKRITGCIDAVQNEERDLSSDEDAAVRRDRDFCTAAEAAVSIHDRLGETRERAQQVQRELSKMRGEGRGPGQLQTRQAMAGFDANLRAGVPQRLSVSAQDLEVYCRAATTATAGESTEVVARSGRPPFIWAALGMNFQPATSNRVQGPTWQPLVSQPATAEGGTKPEMVDSVLDDQELAPYGVTYDISDQVARFGVGETAVADRLSAEAVFSANGGIINRFELHGSEIAFVSDAPTSLDTGIAEVVSRTGGATGVVINAADYPAVAA
ncbi:MAG: hypothetical protein GEU78_18195, partial [Actinobacteria bacterium]|nr:hypothetical protein [Actinomycetota bacterium]